MSNKPRVSIGLPVYNGEQFLEETLDSILAQTYPDFELIISDNASTDRTEVICRAYAARDRRIRYYRNETNLGAARNFNRTFELSLSEYFKWSAHDDMMAPDFLRKCVEVLDCDPSVILCFSKMKIIKHGEVRQSNYSDKLNNVDSLKPQDRLRDLILKPHSCYHVWGLMRRNILEKTPLIGSYIGSDRPLLAELALLGRFYELPEVLFTLRLHPARSGQDPYYLRTRWWDTANEGKLTLPNWRQFFEYFKAIRRVPLSRTERMWCFLCLGRWVVTHWNWAKMMFDLLVAVEPRCWRLHMKIKNWLKKHKKSRVLSKSGVSS